MARKRFWNYPPTQNQYMQDSIVGELIFARIHVGTVFALARIQDMFPHISHILEGIQFGANTCRACIRTRANTGKIA